MQVQILLHKSAGAKVFTKDEGHTSDMQSSRTDKSGAEFAA